MNVALSELPDFTALPGRAPAEHHASGIIIAPSLAYMERAYFDARSFGRSRRPIIELVIPSTLDGTLAPRGQHVASLFCQHVAPKLADGSSWDDHREAVADLVSETVDDLAPNFRRSVLARQILSARPMLGYADYRGPIAGLYLCGSGGHPGGGVTGAPGHNAAREFLRDFKRNRIARIR
jgi:phytoene dehydrogenase-like protein